MLKKKIVVLGTGGTIAGLMTDPAFDLAYEAAQLSVQALVAQLNPQSEFDVHCEQVMQIDSKNMSHSHWQVLVSRVNHWVEDETAVGVVITHGTDTLEETAFFLHALLQPQKPVVFTCAMRPADAPASDGPQNLADALRLAAEPACKGVMVVCASYIHDAVNFQKVHAHRLNAFDSGDAGELGQIVDQQLIWHRNQEQAFAGYAYEAIDFVANCNPLAWPWVAVLTSHAGADGRMVDSLVSNGVQGIVVAGTGNFTVHEELERALSIAQDQDVQVLLTTRCPYGGDRLYELKSNQGALKVTPALNAVKARVALMLELMTKPLRPAERAQ